jgi:hypothetical protein
MRHRQNSNHGNAGRMLATLCATSTTWRALRFLFFFLFVLCVMDDRPSFLLLLDWLFLVDSSWFFTYLHTRPIIHDGGGRPGRLLTFLLFPLQTFGPFAGPVCLTMQLVHKVGHILNNRKPRRCRKENLESQNSRKLCGLTAQLGPSYLVEISKLFASLR